ncbi:MAG: class I SAM-dependent methyltransferase [Pyrodictiaceae archaeon]
MNCDPLLKILYRFMPAKAYAGLARRPRGTRLVIDIGSGAGGLGEALAEQGGLAEYVVVDPDECLLDLAPRTAWSHLVQGVAEHLPLRTGIAAVAVMHDALHHVEEPEKALREAARVAHCIAISDVDPRSHVGRLVALLEKLLHYPAKFLEPARVSAMLGSEGLATIVEEGRHGSYVVRGCRDGAPQP